MNQQLAKWTEMVSRWWRDESGVTAIEYGLLAALIAVVCIGAFNATGTSLEDSTKTGPQRSSPRSQ